MSEAPSSNLPTVPYSTLLMLLLAVSGLLAVRANLSSDRPDQDTAPSLPLPGEQNIDARLWQDPFGALTRFESETRLWGDDGRRLQLGRHIGDQLDRFDRLHDAAGAELPEEEKPRDRILLLPVMASGGPYSEDSEKRRRLRVAVLSALLSRGYSPESSELIGAFLFESEISSTGPWETPVPYEWLTRDPFADNPTGLPDSILVMWLQERALADEPVRRAEQIVSEPLAMHLARLRAEERGQEIIRIKRLVRVCVLGPSNSGMLASMVREVIGRRNESFTLREIDSHIAAAPKPPSEGVPDQSELRLAKTLLQTANRSLPFRLPRKLSAHLVIELANALVGARGKENREELALEELFGGGGTVDMPRDWQRVVASSVRDAMPKVTEAETDEVTEVEPLARAQYNALERKLRSQAQTRPQQQRLMRQAGRLSQLERRGPSRARRKPQPVDASAREEAAGAQEAAQVAERQGTREQPDAEQQQAEQDGESDSKLEAAAQAIAAFAGIRESVIEALSPQATIYSPRATVPDPFLFPPATRVRLREQHLVLRAHPHRGKHMTEHFFEAPLDNLFGQRSDGSSRFVRTVCTDDVLAKALLQELELRGVSLAQGHHIALIKESESLYGSTIRRTFVDVAPTPNADTLVHEFGYLRGLDGQLPSDRDDSAGVDPVAPAPDLFGSTQRARADDVTPFGRNQYDQVHRLARAINQLDTRLEDDGACPRPVRAIGVVGSDIYDKLLVLSALREQFPDKLFFTVDLDARLVVTPRYAATRNLIIASGFGLELGRSLQRGVGAYRDSYQTSAHLAVLRALGTTDAPLVTERLERDPWREMLDPRVFEIGRTRAVDLNATPRSALHPPIEPRQPRWRTVWLTAFVFAVTGLGLWRLRALGWHRLLGLRRVELVHKPLWIGLAIIATPLVGIAYGIFENMILGAGEPAYLSEGVSVWPTETLRILATMMTAVLIHIAILQITDSDAKLNERFFGSDSNAVFIPELARPWRLWRWFGGRRKLLIPSRLIERKASYPASLSEGDLNDLWQRYRWLGLPAHRLARIAPHALLISTAAVAVVLWPPAPLVPYRGGIANAVDHVATVMVVTAVVTLSLFVIDAMRLAVAFTKTLSGATSEWKTTAYTGEIAKARGLDTPDVRDFIDVLVVARQSRVHGNLLLYPFVVLFLMVFAQYGTFDAWRWPLLFVGLLAALAATILGNGIALIVAARKARRRSLRRLGEKLSALQGGSGPPHPDSFELLVKDAGNVREGAFSTFANNPVLNAVLVPSGGLGALSLLDLLNRAVP